MSIGTEFLQSSIANFKTLHTLGSKTLSQLTYEELHYQPTPESNSIAIIVKHLNGNMLSRFTDFLTTDGEKSYRNRDGEFEGDYTSKEALLDAWTAGWNVVFTTLTELKEDDLMRTVTIRKEPHTVILAITRQIQHYGYHVGQIVYAGKQIKDQEWQQLSIARGQSKAFDPLR
jgi:hypothetical protein